MVLNLYMKVKMYLFIGFVFLALAGPASADTITVNNGKEGDYKSIQKAINNSNPGDTISVYPGTYKENLVVDRELRIISKSGNPENTIVLAAIQKEHVFKIVSDNVTIKGFKIKDASGNSGNYKYGIYLEETKNCTIDNNYISNNREGIFLIDSSNNTIINNKLPKNNDAGIILRSSDHNTIMSNNLSGNIAGIVIIYSSSDNRVDGNTVFENIIGIDIQGNNNTIGNNTISNNGKYGIGIESSADNAISSNIVNSNERNGIKIEFSKNNSLKNNTINFNGMDGVFLLHSNNNTLNGNNASNNTNHGISLMDCDHNLLHNNFVNRNNANGIQLWNKGTEIDDDAIFEWGGSGDNILSNNTASNNTAYGIYIGISGDNNTLKNNSVYSNGKYGIFLAEASRNNELEGNRMDSNLLGEVLVSSEEIPIGSSELSTPEISSQEMEEDPGKRLRGIPFIGCFITGAIVGTAAIIMKRKQE
ncbi:Cell surface protein [Methanosarcina siciliae C2J]|uniref:Cell surface protein n=1 Tax=Methanosarcina siciliae C2J TaxID=1434118 RepID=A0A0E3PUQ0_9EURY|nr:NosD domain-containing protein [Methanosarcina siciliae]AKB38815.1 Cell surface protein [Methanosarcina siciliae C2J]